MTMEMHRKAQGGDGRRETKSDSNTCVRNRGPREHRHRNSYEHQKCTHYVSPRKDGGEKRIKREVGHPGKHWMIGQMVMFFISLVFGFDHGAVFGCQLEFFLARNGCGYWHSTLHVVLGTEGFSRRPG